MLLAVVVALVVTVLVALLGVGGGITSIGDMRLLASSLLSDWRSVLGAEAVDLFIHLSLGNVVLSVMVVVLVSMLTKGRVVGTWGAAVSGVWLGLPLPLSQWWKILLGEAVDFLVHASLSDITVVLLVMLLGFALVEGAAILGTGVTSVWHMWESTSSLLSNWGAVVGGETMHLGVHCALSNILLGVVMVLLVALLVEGRVVGAWVAAVCGIWLSSSLPFSEWWEVLLGESMNFLIHSSLGNISLMVFVMFLRMMFVMVLMLIFMMVSMFNLGKTVGSIR